MHFSYLRVLASHLPSVMLRANHQLKQSYAAIDERASAYIHPLLYETETQYRRNVSSDSITTVSAIQVFLIGCQLVGKPEQARELDFEARSMAERMGLFGSQTQAQPSSVFQSESSYDRTRAEAHAAWGIFNYHK